MDNNLEMKKEELEKLIAEKWTLGNYIFDEEKQCFFGDTEVGLCLKQIEDNKYMSCESYFFDGYEVGISDEEAEKLVFYGTEDVVSEKAIEEFNSEPDIFLGYPIFYTNVSVEFVEE